MEVKRDEFVDDDFFVEEVDIVKLGVVVKEEGDDQVFELEDKEGLFVEVLFFGDGKVLVEVEVGGDSVDVLFKFVFLFEFVFFLN